MDLSPISKAIAGGLVTALVAELARYGFHVAPVYVDAVGVLVTGVIAYVVGHIAADSSDRRNTWADAGES
jgi:hypothetical protein